MSPLHAPFLAILLVAQPAATATRPIAAPAPQEVKSAFLNQLDRPKVPLDVVFETSLRSDDGLVTETLSFATEKKPDGRLERVPTLIVRPASPSGKRPVVIVLHGTGGNKEALQPWLVELAKRGIIGVAIDARYHGARSGGAKGAAAYIDAITKAWRTKDGNPQEHPFYYDTCWDIWRTLDYLATREDVDAKRIGVIGISMGGIETWLAAAVDDRIAVAVPAISVQSFRWSLENGQWQGRAKTIEGAHKAAADDLGESEVNARVCRALWSKVIPGILGPFDCPSMIRLFAGRPLLIVNGDLDPNCPIAGARVAIAAAEKAYKEADASDKLRVLVAEGVGHAITPQQHQEAIEWFVRWLKP